MWHCEERLLNRGDLAAKRSHGHAHPARADGFPGSVTGHCSIQCTALRSRFQTDAGLSNIQANSQT